MYKVLQYSPNSRFSVFSAQHSSRRNFHFRPSQWYKAQGPLQQFPWGAGRVSSPPPEPWSGWSQFLAISGLGYLANTGEGPGGPWHLLTPPDTSWHILGHPGTLWDTLAPPWTMLEILEPAPTWKILCSKKMD